MDTKITAKNLKIAKETTEELLKLLNIEAGVKAESLESSISIDISGEDLGLLIGHQGDNLEALQLVLGLIVNNKKNGPADWTPVSVDVGGWREEKSQALKSMIENIAAEIEKEGGERALPPMPASQRRMAHLILADFPGLISESDGEEPNRRVIIKKGSKENGG
ncbi:MAG: R3H domain-containing nucleic acid-binding protein [Candidatus Woykebacteria bacterium]